MPRALNTSRPSRREAVDTTHPRPGDRHRRTALLALALFGLFLAVSLTISVGRATRRIYGSIVAAGETPLEERSRIFDPRYVQAIEEIRRAIPRDGVYALVDADPVEEGSVYWVRFDLAPRRAIYLGFLHELQTPRIARERMVREARWVIVASIHRPPVLYARHDFLRQLRAGKVR